MNLNSFIARYVPIAPPVGDDSLDGYFWDHAHPENNFIIEALRFVNNASCIGDRHIWTLVEGDDGEYVIPGWHFVNRLGYLITLNSWVDPELTIDFEEPEMEDAI